MAYEAGGGRVLNAMVFDRDEYLERFAELVVAAEREACAKVCEAYDSADPLNVSGECAERIRLRGEQ
jgi:hypothetical protein